jgi:dihydrodipicolinate synthase/N-acetylneuraminate lyase
VTAQQIGGIIPPLVTPFRPDGSIDEQAHRAEVRYMVETAKIQGLAVCGSTGEGHTLTTEETRSIVAWTVDEVPRMRQLGALGVDGICTNDPRLFADL